MATLNHQRLVGDNRVDGANKARRKAQANHKLTTKVSGLAPVNDRLSQVDCAVPTIAPLGLAMDGRVPYK